MPIRLKEHRNAYDSHAENSALVKHSLTKDHRIDWVKSRVLFNSKNIGIRRVVEGAIINCGVAMEGNKSFTQEDSFTNELICKEFIRNFNNTNNYYNDRILLATHGAAASLSPVQVAGNPLGPPATGAQADAGNPRDQPRPG